MAASCVLVTNPSSSGPTLTLHNIDSSNGTGSPAGVVFLKKKKKNADWISGGLLLWKVFAGHQKFNSPSSVWGNHTDRRRRVACGHPGEWMHSDLPPSALHVPSSLRRLHPRARRWRSSAPSSGQNAGVSTAPSSSPLFLPRPPPPLPLSVASSKDALSISGTPGVNLVEEQGGREWREEVEVKRGGRERKERKEGEHLTWRQKDNFGRAALFKVKASFAFQKRRPAVLPPQGRRRTNQRVI